MSPPSELTTSSQTPSRRLTSIVSHVSARQKVVVCRNLGPDVMPLLEQRREIDVGLLGIPVHLEI